MGYYTDYDFSNNRQEVVNAINEISGYGDYNESYYNGVKWYDYDKHMKQVSLMFPDEVLELEGVGEEEGDVWKAYYKNGKAQWCRAKIVTTFEPFDESKLK